MELKFTGSVMRQGKCPYQKLSKEHDSCAVGRNARVDTWSGGKTLGMHAGVIN